VAAKQDVGQVCVGTIMHDFTANCDVCQLEEQGSVLQQGVLRGDIWHIKKLTGTAMALMLPSSVVHGL
jgi:hypothetical protein